MLAQCTHCQGTFETGQFGLQRCPRCGVEVMVEDPRLPPTVVARAVPTPGAPAEDETPELTPWERRAELGFFSALWRTIGEILSKPGPFFRRMRYDTDNGSLLYFAIIVVAPELVGDLVEWFMKGSNEGSQIIETLRAAGADIPKEATQFIAKYYAFESSPTGLASSLVSTFVMYFGGLFAVAGIVHGILRLIGKAPGGWKATLKGTCYAATPLLVGLVPFLCCAGLLGTTWATGLQIYAMAKAHKTTMTWASIGVIGMHLVLVIVTGLIAFGAVTLMGGGSILNALGGGSAMGGVK